MTRRALLPLLMAAGLLLAGSMPAAHAQLAADAHWRTLESTNFRVTYESGLEPLARRAAASAERAHAALSALVADAPRGPIDIVVADNVDLSNGYATPFPSNRIVVYAKPPADVLELQYVGDWIDLVVTHELAHIFHLDVSGAAGRLMRAIFGRLPAPWPVFTAVGTPAWSIEGLAVSIESMLAGLGRIHGSYHEMIVRTAVLSGEMDGIDRLVSGSPLWPGNARVYIYGSLFYDYLARRYGPDVARHIVRETAGSVLPAPIWFDDVGRAALGITFTQAYADWYAELEARYARLAAELQQRGLTASEPLTDHGAWASYPRFSPDGRAIAYAASDLRSLPRTRVIDSGSGRELWSRRRHDLAPAAWLDDERLLTSYLDFVDRFRIYSDVHSAHAGGDTRVSRGARLQSVDVAGRGSIVAVQNGGGTNRLVLLGSDGAVSRAVTPFDLGTNWSMPRFAPDGARIAAGRWRAGGEYDIVVLDTTGTLHATISAGSGISAAPAWSPDGQWVLFWSDRTGIPNIFAARTDGSGLRQVTNTLTGAFFPDVSPDGRWIVVSAYHEDGFRIERVPFDPGSWRDPMPADFAMLAASRGSYLTPVDPRTWSGMLNLAVAAADTTAGASGRYRPLRHLRPYAWVPDLTDGGRNDPHLGFWMYGRDLVERHAWDLYFSVGPSTGRTQAAFNYTYRGLPTLPVAGLHPALSLAIARDWDEWLPPDSLGRYIDQREDVLSAGVLLSRQRWRRAIGLNVSGERVWRSRHLFNSDLTLRDPDDGLLGARAVAYYGSTYSFPFSLTPQGGVNLQLGARRLWDQSVRDTTIGGRRLIDDGSYSEFTTYNTGYLSLPFSALVPHVLAMRVSGLRRDGRGAGLTGIGGVSAAGLELSGLAAGLTGSRRLLPLRGVPPGARRGNRAWTASAEYRLPLGMPARTLHPLPVFFDRFGGVGFVDAGHAWCDARLAARAPGACSSDDAGARPLVSAGMEAVALFSAFSARIPLRLGVAMPIATLPTDELAGSPRFFLVGGLGF
jgi:hypothetical protein